jgi:apolipoprotein N-acyltransferase
MNFRFLSGFLAGRPNVSMFLAGMLAVLALPPVNILPFIFLSLGWLVLSIAGAQNLRQAFWRGWMWGAGYFIFGWYWISFALRFDWPRFAWLLPLSALALPCAMAIYIGVMGCVIHWLAQKFQNKKRTKKFWAIFLFPIFFTAFELLRGHLFTGFPWNIIGITLTEYAPLFQTAAIVGEYGLGFIIAASVSVWLISNEISKYKNILRGSVIFVWIIMAAFGFWRLHEPQINTHPLNVRIVQPDTSQEGRWDGARRLKILNTLTMLTASPGILSPNLVVWPEAAAPYPLAPFPPVRQRIAQSLPPGAILATGSIRRDDQTRKLYNSIEYLNTRGDILGHYDKFHLVPFGEYMPYSDVIHIPAVAEIFGNLGRGAGPQTQTINGLRISPMICYEAIFPGEVTDGNNPQLLLNVTDDVWYGNTSGPYQHLAQARARAVEEGLPLVRAANNGISAAVDRYGRVMQSIPYDAVGYTDAQITVADAPVPPPAAHGMFYAWLGLLALAYLTIGLAAGLIGLHAKKS